jgi:hypothetical protein
VEIKRLFAAHHGRYGSSREAISGVIFHSDQGSEGGFNRSNTPPAASALPANDAASPSGWARWGRPWTT